MREVVLVPITAGIPQILSPSLRYYRGSYPHSHWNTTVIVHITVVVITVFPPSSSPCHYLVLGLWWRSCEFDSQLGHCYVVTSMMS